MAEEAVEEGKFQAFCSSCGKNTLLPFEPQPGRPVYCKECLTKIKAGTLRPVRVGRDYVPTTDKRADKGTSILNEFQPKIGEDRRKAPREPQIASEMHLSDLTQREDKPKREPAYRVPIDIEGLRKAITESLSKATKPEENLPPPAFEEHGGESGVAENNTMRRAEDKNGNEIPYSNDLPRNI